MQALFESGRIIDLILVFIVVEAALLWRWRRDPALLIGLLPGAALMLAVRQALVGAWWGYVAAWLGAALVLHLWDLRRRGEGASPRAPQRFL